MYCKNCGNQINDNAVVCIHCGCSVEQPKQAQVQAPQKTNVLAIIGFVLSFLMPLAGLICSVIGYKQVVNDSNSNGKGLALAGTIISAISLALEVIASIVIVIMWAPLWINILTMLW